MYVFKRTVYPLNTNWIQCWKKNMHVIYFPHNFEQSQFRIIRQYIWTMSGCNIGPITNRTFILIIINTG